MANDKIFRKVFPDNISKVMEHCIGYDPKKVYKRGGKKFFKPYRNYYDAAGHKMAIWDKLVSLGYAECNKSENSDHAFYWLNSSGLAALSDNTGVYIYSENASGNEIDCEQDIIDIMLDYVVKEKRADIVPITIKYISNKARLPRDFVMYAMRYLRDECGYVKYVTRGEQDERGNIISHKGWELTDKWIKENRDRFNKAMKG